MIVNVVLAVLVAAPLFVPVLPFGGTTETLTFGSVPPMAATNPSASEEVAGSNAHVTPADRSPVSPEAQARAIASHAAYSSG